MNDQVTVDQVIELLNSMLSCDSVATTELINHRVNCSEQLAIHPTIQVRQHPDDEFPKVGILGVINGMFGIDENGVGPICCVVDDVSKAIIKFKRTSSPTLDRL